jgi:hypothetical protein
MFSETINNVAETLQAERIDEALKHAKTTTKGCLEHGEGDGKGRYGARCMRIKSSAMLHRLVYCYVYGPIPKGLVVMHTCDNPRCFNVSHLVLGTYRDNTMDAIHKGRWPKHRKVRQ